MSPRRGSLDTLLTGFPRVSGDEPLSWNRKEAPLTFSPRERG